MVFGFFCPERDNAAHPNIEQLNMTSSVDSNEIFQGIDLDIGRHAGNQAPTAAIPKPQVGGAFELNGAVVRGK